MTSPVLAERAASPAVSVRSRVADVSAVDLAERRALVCTATVGVLVAWAPALWAPVRHPILVLALGAWVVALAGWLAAGSRRLLGGPASGRVALAIAAAGAAVALLLAGELELIRRVGQRPAFTWLHDWRWGLNQAQAIARSGDVRHALDYAGAGLDYHVGPAWLAAAVQRSFGWGLADVMFGVVPCLALLSVLAGGVALLRSAGIPRRWGLLAVTTAMTLPLSDRSVLSLGDGVVALHSPVSWPFLPTDMMLNSMFGLAVGTTAMALLWTAANPVGLVVASVALASVLQLKPQFYAGLALLAGLAGTARLLRAGGSRGRQAWPLIGVALSLPLALVGLAVLPGDLPYLGWPVWAPATTRGPFVEAIRVGSVLGVASMLCWIAARRLGRVGSAKLLIEWMIPAGLAVGGLAAVFYFLDFPYRREIVQRLLALGVDARSSAIRGDEALAQALEPPRLILLMVSLATLGMLARRSGRFVGWAGAAAAALIVMAPVPLLVAGAVSPPPELAVAEEEGLRQVLQRVPLDQTLLAASDLADPADSSKRALRAPLLTAYDGHAFYVANLRYVHYARGDALTRLHELRRVFGTPWSAWQEGWLRRTGVTHLLLDDRCPAVWESQAGAPLTLVAQAGRWRIYRWTGQATATSGDGAEGDGDVAARYGRAACLSGAWAASVSSSPPARVEASGRSGTGP